MRLTHGKLGWCEYSISADLEQLGVEHLGEGVILAGREEVLGST